MLSQMLNRRFTLTTKWKNYLPNLIIIDGGKGHLNVSYPMKVLKNDVFGPKLAKIGENRLFHPLGVMKR